MKIILSRKGFDSSAGGVPSPILPDGTLLSLPIPEDLRHPEKHTRDYDAVFTPIGALGPIVTALTGGRINGRTPVHLDPDLWAGSCERQPGWRPGFGQAAAAESHLRNQSVGPGDLFLFFGWFREVDTDPWRYRRGAPDKHVLFGWFQVDERWDVHGGSTPDWAREHPHLRGRPYGPADSLYVAAERLTFDGVVSAPPGAGVFRTCLPVLELTAPGRSRSVWHVPAALADGRRSRLSYHRHRSCRHVADGVVELQTVGRGQEFVADGSGTEAWLRRIFSCAAL